MSSNITNDTTFTTVGALDPDYTLNNVYASVQCYSLANGVYDNMIADQMSSNGNLEIGFKQYFSFRDLCTGTARWSVACQSLDRVIVCHHRDVGSNVRLPPVLVTGYNAIGETNSARLLGLGKARYLQQPSSFNEAGTTSKNLYEIALNGARYPQWRATAEDMYAITRLASRDGARQHEWGLASYLDSFFVQAIKLTLDAPNARFAQGLDTRSVSLNGYYYIHNISGSKNITLFAECTSSLLVGVGRQIEVIQ